ncbi:MAG TPA: nucleotide sugar dehydrogenase [Candidatus Krumholzibacteria bacterium]|nr:nucleotide sugar dehydrogenase [Candidatus Krumholzibacteria bacterium]
MRISIFGLGYVGCVSAACFAKNGHTVIGVDVAPAKREILMQGRSPVIEKDLDELMAEGVKNGRLSAVASAADAIAGSDISLICVGTPSNPNSSLNLEYVRRVCEEIGEALRSKKERHIVCVRSTMVPGSTDGVVIPALTKGLGGTLPARVEVAVNPEFLREGTAVYDFFNPPKTVVGADRESTADTVVGLYAGIEAPVFKTPIKVAETVKYVDNVFHAVKITFANEIGSVCKSMGVDSHEVMRIFTEDRKLNISPAYLKPGFAFGGSCLPKDVRALVYLGRSKDLTLPLLSALLPSNDLLIERAAHMIFSHGKKRLAFLGMSFKPGTDDLRESPLVRLIEHCLGKGYDLRIFDQSVSVARLTGANKAYIEKEIPHISRLLSTDLNEVIAFADVIVVGHRTKEFAAALQGKAAGKTVVDLARVFETPPTGPGYEGITW